MHSKMRIFFPHFNTFAVRIYLTTDGVLIVVDNLGVSLSFLEIRRSINRGYLRCVLQLVVSQIFWNMEVSSIVVPVTPTLQTSIHKRWQYHSPHHYQVRSWPAKIKLTSPWVQRVLIWSQTCNRAQSTGKFNFTWHLCHRLISQLTMYFN